MDTTIIYYTSNREKPEFETKIQKNLFSVIGDTPLISISQQPIDFGENICVGNVGTSDHNIYRQIQLECLKAKTKYVCTAKADCLYPPTEYFNFVPSNKKPHPLFHRYQNSTKFANELTVINIKTKEGMRWFIGTKNTEKKSLPHWRKAEKLERQLWDNK